VCTKVVSQFLEIICMACVNETRRERKLPSSKTAFGPHSLSLRFYFLCVKVRNVCDDD